MKSVPRAWAKVRFCHFLFWAVYAQCGGKKPFRHSTASAKKQKRQKKAPCKGGFQRGEG
jgi:hypothetical protein